MLTTGKTFRKILGTILFLSPVWVVIAAFAKVGLLIELIIVFGMAFLVFLCIRVGMDLLEM